MLLFVCSEANDSGTILETVLLLAYYADDGRAVRELRAETCAAELHYGQAGPSRAVSGRAESTAGVPTRCVEHGGGGETKPSNKNMQN